MYTHMVTLHTVHTKLFGQLHQVLVARMDHGSPTLVQMAIELDYSSAPANLTVLLLPHVNVEVLPSQFSQEVGRTAPPNARSDDGYSRGRELLLRLLARASPDVGKQTPKEWDPLDKEAENSAEHVNDFSLAEFIQCVELSESSRAQ